MHREAEENRWKKFNINDIKERNYKLDISWLKDDSLEGFLCSDSEYNKCHIRGNACVVIFLITEELAENRILYSNGNHTDGHKHLSERMKDILDEINKNSDRSKFNFA